MIINQKNDIVSNIFRKETLLFAWKSSEEKEKRIFFETLTKQTDQVIF